MGTATKHITHLSFSRLTQLEHSPAALAKYIEKRGETTKAITAGSLFDCLLFTPELVKDRFVVIPDVSLATKEGKAAYAEAKEGATKGQQIIKQAEYDNAAFLCECVKGCSTVAYNGLLNPDQFSFQVPVEFFYGGFLHRGVKDADGKDRDGRKVIWDLKRMGNASGEYPVRAQIRKNRYDLQAAIYCWPYDSKGEAVEHYIIAVDNEGFVTPFRISKDARQQARFLWNKLVRAAGALNEIGLDAGPEFWAGFDGFFEF